MADEIEVLPPESPKQARKLQFLIPERENMNSLSALRAEEEYSWRVRRRNTSADARANQDSPLRRMICCICVFFILICFVLSLVYFSIIYAITWIVGLGNGRPRNGTITYLPDNAAHDY